MRRLVYDRNGSTLENMTFEREVRKPDKTLLSRGQVIVQVKAAGINPIDYKYPNIPLVNISVFGNVVGQDFAGIVSDVFDDESNYEIGDMVFGVFPGAMADFIIASESCITKMPTNVSFNEACTLTTEWVTSLQCLRSGKLSEGKSILIIGESLVGILVAKAMLQNTGRIVVLCSLKNCGYLNEYLRENDSVFCGDDIQLMDKSKSPLCNLGPFDIVYDTLTSSEFTENFHGIPYYSAFKYFLKSPRDGGRYIAINGSYNDIVWKLLGWQRPGFSIEFMSKQGLKSDLGIIAKLVENQKLTAVIDSITPFSEAEVQHAFKRIRSRKIVGKIVFDFTM